MDFIDLDSAEGEVKVYYSLKTGAISMDSKELGNDDSVLMIVVLLFSDDLNEYPSPQEDIINDFYVQAVKSITRVCDGERIGSYALSKTTGVSEDELADKIEKYLLSEFKGQYSELFDPASYCAMVLDDEDVYPYRAKARY